MRPTLTGILASLPRRLLSLIVIFVVLISPSIGEIPYGRAESQDLQESCHFGIALAGSSAAYDLTSLGVDAVLNWTVSPPVYLPANIRHIKVLRLRNDLYPTTLANLQYWLSAYPEAVWIIGNEPDVHFIQDELLPEVYAERYFELATLIRVYDPNAQIGFGPVAQMTPIRRRYLDRVLTRLDTLSGNRNNTLNLIDIFTPHAFLVNEQYEMWGAGIPVGLEEQPDPYVDPEDAFIVDIVTEISKTYSISYFSQFVFDFRTWMRDRGARNKPLWITEYGSLMPPIDHPDGGDFYNVSDEDTRDYMVQTFDYILSAKYPNIGYASDYDRLVQYGFWYSLNELRWVFGGSLFDPMTHQRTIVGDSYVTYDPPGGAVDIGNLDVYPISTLLDFQGYTPGSNDTQGDFQLNFRLGNLGVSDFRTRVTVELRRAGDNALIGSGSGYLARCGGQGVISIDWLGVDFGTTYDLRLYVSVDPSTGVDTNLSNNTWMITITPGEPSYISLPLISR